MQAERFAQWLHEKSQKAFKWFPMKKERQARPRHSRTAGKHVVQPTSPNFYDKIYNYFDLSQRKR